jgi:hypothetical protein
MKYYPLCQLYQNYVHYKNNCILVTIAYSITFVKKEKQKLVRAKYLHNEGDQIFDWSIMFFISHRFLPHKENKINKELVMFRNKKQNSRPFLTLKVGHRHLYNEGNFLWRRSEQSCDSTPFVM